MRWSLLLLMVVSLSTTLPAHHPNKECQDVHPRCDLIGPLGTRLPMSYRRRYNRPRYLGGKIAYHIAPSSQEAMAWHEAEHLGAYSKHRPRIEKHFFYPKPWEALRVGPREPASGTGFTDDGSLQLESIEIEPIGLVPAEPQEAAVDQLELEPLSNEAELIE